MKTVAIKKCDPFFIQQLPSQDIPLEAEDYKLRIDALIARMKQTGKTHVVIFGDREHFAHLDYFSNVDCRFEEALLIFDEAGKSSIIVGNEGISQTYQIPYAIEMYLYQNFSLQGQPRHLQKSLPEILTQIGINKDSRVGLVGYKYFHQNTIDSDPLHTHDVPAYILTGLQKVCPDVTNFTRELTGHPDGIRLRVRTAREIARIEAAGNKVSSVMVRMLQRLKPGISELELSYGVSDMAPQNVHPMVNFGAQSVRIGVKSPGSATLTVGEVCGMCYSLRNNLTARVGIAAYDEQSVNDELKPHLHFYKELWQTVAEVLSYMRVGASCTEMHEIAMRRIGGSEFGVALNITHDTGTDEWMNSPVFKDSPYSLLDGAHIQVDVIASNADPVRCAICEDCVVIAGPELRAELKRQNPEVYERIVARQKMIRQELGIQLHDDVLPMSNLTGVYFPYMLNIGQIFALSE